MKNLVLLVSRGDKFLSFVETFKTYIMNSSWKLYAWMITKSSIFACAMIVVWLFIFCSNFKVIPEDSEVMAAVVGGFLVFSALLPSFTISRLSQQYDDFKSALIRRDVEAFKSIHLRNVHPLTYIAIIVVSLLAIIALMMLPYQRTVVGIFSIGGLSFVHAFFYFVAKELDNPTHWNLNIPEDFRNELKKTGIDL